MGMDNISDKVNINVGDGGGFGGGGAGMAAVIAALGNRNEGSDNAALIAALGNRNDDSSNWAPLMAMMGQNNNLAPLLAMMGDRRHDNDGLGSMWPLLLLLLLGNRRGGGLFGGDGDGCGAGPVVGANVLDNLSDLRAQIPTVALENQNAILGAISQLALGTQNGFSNTKDAIQNTLFALTNGQAGINQNVSAQGCQTREAVQNDGDKTRALLVARFTQEDQTRIAEQNARIVALETRCDNDRRHSEATLQITNTNTAVAAQAQFQQQQQQQFQIDASLERAVGRIVGSFNQTMLARQGQDIVNLGTMTASGTQAAANTQVR